MRHWLHVGLIALDGKKMSKSLGNLVFVADLLKEFEPMAIRLALLAHHYRGDWEWHRDDAEEAAARLERWRAAPTTTADAEGDRGIDIVRRALDDDLDTPAALGGLDECLSSGHPVAHGAALLGVEL